MSWSPDPRRLSAFAVALVLFSLVPRAATPAPFGFDTLFSGRSVKQSVESRTWEAGIRFEIAPIREYVKESLRQYVDAHPEVQPVYGYIQELDPTLLASGTPQEIETALLQIQWLEEQDRSQIRQVFQEAPPEQVDQVVGSIHGLAPLLTDQEEAVAFSLSPYFLYNFKYLHVSAELPLAGFATASDTDFTVGNLNFDARFGHHFGDLVSFGLSYGAAVYLPTAGSRADALALQNALEAPRFVHHYLTLAPYLVVGVDLLRWVKIQAHVELLDLLGVRDDPERSVGVAFRWSTSLILSVFDVFAINVELDGAENLKDAPDFAALYLTGGIRSNIFGFQVGAAVQTPLNLVTGSGRQTTEAALANVAEINVVVTTAFEW